jgi:hypothetical protein
MYSSFPIHFHYFFLAYHCNIPPGSQYILDDGEIGNGVGGGEEGSEFG